MRNSIVYFIKYNDHNPNKASTNRFDAIVKMACVNFDVKVIVVQELQQPFAKYKILRGFAWKYRIVKATLKAVKNANKVIAVSLIFSFCIFYVF